MQAEKGSTEIRIWGIGVHPGTIAAPALLYRPLDLTAVQRNRFPVADAEDETRRLDKSVYTSLSQLEKLCEGDDPELNQIFQAQCLLLQDTSFLDTLKNRISEGGDNIEYTLAHQIIALEEKFNDMKDAKMQQQFLDVEDVYSRLLRNLLGIEHIRSTPLEKLKEPSILVTESLLPSDFAVISRTSIVGLCIEEANVASHVGIIASTLGIPAIINVKGITSLVKSREVLAMDGDRGETVLRPGENTLKSFRLSNDSPLQPASKRRKPPVPPCITSDGQRILLLANIGSLREAYASIEEGADGIGLLRTEFFHLSKSTPPSQTEEINFIRQIYSAVNERPLTVRLVDSGADKAIPGLNCLQENNPQLGLRGIRLLLKNPDFFKKHLLNILHASSGRNVRLLIPFISRPEEFDQAVDFILSTTRGQGMDSNSLSLGIMVEIPSVVLDIETYMEKIDFLSIGTNDLFQYSFAVSREDAGLDDYRRPLNPVMLKMIKRVSDCALQHRKELSVCGELASFPFAAVVLAGLGIRALSMSYGKIGRVRNALAAVSLSEATQIAGQCLACTHEHEMNACFSSLREKLSENAGE